MTHRVPFRASQLRDYPRWIIGHLPVLQDSHTQRWLDEDDFAFIERIKTTGRLECHSLNDLMRPTPGAGGHGMEFAIEYCKNADRSRSAIFNDQELELHREQRAAQKAEYELYLRRLKAKAIKQERQRERARLELERERAAWLEEKARERREAERRRSRWTEEQRQWEPLPPQLPSGHYNTAALPRQPGARERWRLRPDGRPAWDVYYLKEAILYLMKFQRPGVVLHFDTIAMNLDCAEDELVRAANELMAEGRIMKKEHA